MREIAAPTIDQTLVRILAGDGDRSPLSDEIFRTEFLRAAARHKVLGLAAEACRAYLPPEAQAWRQKVRVQHMVWFQNRTRALDSVLALLDTAGVDWICLKGPALARRYYAQPFLRKPSNDLDIAVRKCDLDAAILALRPLGYRPEPIAKALACNHHVELTASGQMPIELHFRLSHGSAGIPVEELFSRTVAVQFSGGRLVRVLGESDQVLHLLLHAGGTGHIALFHLLELHMVSRQVSQHALREAIDRAVANHFAGVVKTIDGAFRYYWLEPFASPVIPLPPTWLGWTLGPRFHLELRDWRSPDARVGLWLWLRSRWLEFRMTDRPADGLRLLVRMAMSSWFRIRCRLPGGQRAGK